MNFPQTLYISPFHAGTGLLAMTGGHFLPFLGSHGRTAAKDTVSAKTSGNETKMEGWKKYNSTPVGRKRHYLPVTLSLQGGKPTFFKDTRVGEREIGAKPTVGFPFHDYQFSISGGLPSI